MHRVLADALIMCAKARAIQEKPSPWLLCYHQPIPSRSDSGICRLCLNNQWATLHHQHIASDSTRPIWPSIAQPTPRQAEELHRRALTGMEDQLGPVHPDTLGSVCNLADLLELKCSFAEAMGISVGSRRWAVLLGSGKCGKSGLSSHGLVCGESLHNTVIVLGASSS